MSIKTFSNSFLFIFIYSFFYSQEYNNDTMSISDLCEHNHHNEFGISNAPVWFVKENIFSYGLHFHYIHSIKHSNIGIGLGYERIFDSHGHNTIGFVTSYRIFEKLNFIISPGINFEDSNPSMLNFALHLETAYEFEFKNFHFGPAFEYAIDSEDYHLSLGLHLAIGF